MAMAMAMTIGLASLLAAQRPQLEMTLVGEPCNPPKQVPFGQFVTNAYARGRVDYTYLIGVREVTCQEYCDFLNECPPDFLEFAWSEDTGIVNVIAEVSAGKPVAISSKWAERYPAFVEKFGDDFTAAITKKTGKRDSAGNDMFVWQDFVAGTDPTDENDKFTASITFDADGKPQIAYSPKFENEAEAAKRKYTTYGKARLNDKEWTEVAPGEEDGYNFFKVTVEMR